MASKTTTAQKIGLVVLALGVLYMLWGFVASWWLVPASHEGAEITAGSAGMIWSMSFPLGSFVAIAGAGLGVQCGAGVVLVAQLLELFWHLLLPHGQVQLAIRNGHVLLAEQCRLATFPPVHADRPLCFV